MSFEVDTVVCGLGVAGLTYMNACSSNEVVLGLEKRPAKVLSHKAVLLTRHAHEQLMALGVNTYAANSLQKVDIQTRSGIKTRNAARWYLPSYMLVDQGELEASLLRGISPDAVRFNSTVRKIVVNPGSVSIEVEEAGETKSITAKRVVIADGVTGRLARMLGAKRQFTSLIQKMTAATVKIINESARSSTIRHYITERISVALIPIPTVEGQYRVYVSKRITQQNLIDLLAEILVCQKDSVYIVGFSHYVTCGMRLKWKVPEQVIPIGDCTISVHSALGTGMSLAINQAIWLGSVSRAYWSNAVWLLFLVKQKALFFDPIRALITCFLVSKKRSFLKSVLLKAAEILTSFRIFSRKKYHHRL